jgi:hypothetical protein
MAFGEKSRAIRDLAAARQRCQIEHEPYLGMLAESAELMRELVEQGMDPAQIAAYIVEGMVAKRKKEFYLEQFRALPLDKRLTMLAEQLGDATIASAMQAEQARLLAHDARALRFEEIIQTSKDRQGVNLAQIPADTTVAIGLYDKYDFDAPQVPEFYDSHSADAVLRVASLGEGQFQILGNSINVKAYDTSAYLDPPIADHVITPLGGSLEDDGAMGSHMAYWGAALYFANGDTMDEFSLHADKDNYVRLGVASITAAGIELMGRTTMPSHR